MADQKRFYTETKDRAFPPEGWLVGPPVRPGSVGDPPSYWKPGTYTWERWRTYFGLTEEEARGRWL